MKFPILTIVCLLLLGCAGTRTSEFVCTSDWFETGRLDGQAGRPGEQIDLYIRDCAVFDVVPERQVYERGRQEGLQAYCTQDNGYAVAIDGGQLGNVCPSEMATVFRDGFRDGELMLLARQAVGNLYAEQSQIENDIRCAQAEIDGGTANLGIVGVGSESNASRQAREDIPRLEEQLGRVQTQTDNVENQCIDLVRRHQAVDYRIESSYCQATGSGASDTASAPALFAGLQSVAENACARSASSQ